MGLINGYNNPKYASTRRPEENYHDLRGGTSQRRTDGAGLGPKYEKVLFEYREALAGYQDCLVDYQFNQGGDQSEYVVKYEKMLLEYREALTHFKECILQCQTKNKDEKIVNTEEYEKTLLEYRQALAGYKNCLLEATNKQDQEVVVNTDVMDATLAQYKEVLSGYKDYLDQYKMMPIPASTPIQEVNVSEIDVVLSKYKYELERIKSSMPQGGLAVNTSEMDSLLAQYRSELQKIQGDQSFGGQFDDQSINFQSQDIERSVKEIKDSLTAFQDSLVGYSQFAQVPAMEGSVNEGNVEKTLSEYKEALAYYKDCLLQYEEKIDTYDDKLSEYSQNSAAQMLEVQKALDFTYIKEETSRISEQLEAFTLEKQDVANNNPDDVLEIKKKLEDLIRFVAKLDGNIVEAVKTNSTKSKEELLVQLEEIMDATMKSKKGIKPLQVFSLILNLATVGGLAVLILELMGIIVF